MRALVTGGCGFIGSALVRRLLRTGHDVLNIDKLTYAGSEASVPAGRGYEFLRADICDERAMYKAWGYKPDVVFHLAAESHVDRSIESSGPFLHSNVQGTYVMLEMARQHGCSAFVHVSTDEVFGSIAEGKFTERSPYAPNSPYSATKAASDHLARAWFQTYGVPVIQTNSTNNYGPYQFPEKLIPKMVRHALKGEPLTIHGSGLNVRDWLHVDDHVEGLIAASMSRPGERYNFGGNCERRNCDVIQEIANHLNAETVHVTNRAGNDWRYAVDISKAQVELGWSPRETFDLIETVQWYVDHPEWCMRDSSS